MKKKWIACILAVALIVSMFSGCGGNGNSDDGSGNTETSGEKDTLVMAITSDPTQLDPQYSADSYASLLALNTHDTLVRRDQNGEIIPWLADSWTTSEDGLTMTFKIHEGVKFQDGSDLTAEDVVFSLQRAMRIPQSEVFTESFEDVRMVDAHTVELQLLYPDVAVLSLLSNGNNCIVSKKIVEAVGDEEYTNNICGSGPYKLVEWEKGSKLTLVANEDYWAGAPAIKNIELRVLKEASTTLVALQTGDIDMAFNLSALDYQTAAEDSKLAAQEVPTSIVWFLAFNCQMAPLDNKLVRKALVMATDKEQVIQGAVDGAGVPADMILTEDTQGAPSLDSVETIPYDVEGAKELLAQAGYPNGEGLSITLTVREDQTKKIGSILQEQWKQIGVDTRVEVMERSAMLADISAGNLMAYTVGNNSLTMDSSFMLGTLDSNKIPSYNNAFYVNETYDELNRKQAEMYDDPEGRTEVIREMIAIEAEDAPRLLLYYPISNVAYNNTLQNVVCRPSVEQYFWADFSWS